MHDKVGKFAPLRGADAALTVPIFRTRSVHTRGGYRSFELSIVINFKGVRVILCFYDIICKKSIAFFDSFVL